MVKTQTMVGQYTAKYPVSVVMNWALFGYQEFWL